MWEWLKDLFSFVSPVAALREQVGLLKVQLDEAHSLIKRQTAQIGELDAENKQLKSENEAFKKSQQENFLKPIKIDTRGIV